MRLATLADRRAFLARVLARKLGGLAGETLVEHERVARENGERETRDTDWYNRLDDQIAEPDGIGQ